MENTMNPEELEKLSEAVALQIRLEDIPALKIPHHLKKFARMAIGLHPEVDIAEIPNPGQQTVLNIISGARNRLHHDMQNDAACVQAQNLTQNVPAERSPYFVR